MKSTTAIPMQRTGQPAKRRRNPDTLQVWLMMAIPLALFAALVIYPILWNVRFSVYDYNGVAQRFIGFDNFVRVLTDPQWWRAVWNTFYMAFIKILIAMPLAFLIAVMLNDNFRGRDVYRIMNFIPFVLSMSVMSMIFNVMFSGNAGVINSMLMKLHIISAPVEWLGTEKTAMGTVIFVSLWKDIGYLLLLMLAGLQSVPREIYESASIDGANKVQGIWYITLPQMFPILKIILMLEITGALKVFDLVNVLTAGGPNGSTEVMMTYLFNYYFGTDMSAAQQGYAAAVGLVASVIIGLVTVVYLRVSKKEVD